MRESNRIAWGVRSGGAHRIAAQVCVEVVIAMVVMPGGFPLAYEVIAGNV